MTMKIAEVPIDKIKPYGGNPRKMTDEAIATVASSLQEFGWRQPIVVDEKNVVIVGHTRLLAAKTLGMDKVPIHVAEKLTEEQVRAYRIADNAAGERTTWDTDLLPLELDLLKAADYDLKLTALTDDMLAVMEDEVDIEETEQVDPPEEAVTQAGDLIKLGDHRLLCGDSTLESDVVRLMDGVKPALMVTDPPYGVDYAGGQANDKKREKLKNDNDTKVFGSALAVASSIMPKGAWYVWHSDRFALPVYEAAKANGFDVRSVIIWNKLKARYGAPSAHYCAKHEPCLYAVKGNAGFCGASNEVTVWDVEQPARNEHHPTQKPMVCMARAIKNHDAEVVYDPFLGSGTTLLAADQLGRTCYGLEIDPRYCDVIVTRWEQQTGKKAVRVSA